MDTVAHAAPAAIPPAEMPMPEDGTVDFGRLAVGLVEPRVDVAYASCREGGEVEARAGSRPKRVVSPGEPWRPPGCHPAMCASRCAKAG